MGTSASSVPFKPSAIKTWQPVEKGENPFCLLYTSRYISFSVKYNLKNGREVYRSYSVYGNKEYDLVKKIYDSRDYRMAAYPVMEQTAEYTGKIRVKQSSCCLLYTSELNPVLSSARSIR